MALVLRGWSGAATQGLTSQERNTPKPGPPLRYHDPHGILDSAPERALRLALHGWASPRGGRHFRLRGPAGAKTLRARPLETRVCAQARAERGPVRVETLRGAGASGGRGPGGS